MGYCSRSGNRGCVCTKNPGVTVSVGVVSGIAAGVKAFSEGADFGEAVVVGATTGALSTLSATSLLGYEPVDKTALLFGAAMDLQFGMATNGFTTKISETYVEKSQATIIYDATLAQRASVHGAIEAPYTPAKPGGGGGSGKAVMATR